LGYGWFPKGSRTPVNTKLGYENFYVYSATHANNGDHFSLILPLVNTVCMNVFLEQMAEYLGEKKAIVVMDQAAWHKSEMLTVPENITIIHLPPYSPELNPVERLWQYIKNNTIKNKVYSTLEELENVIYNFIKNLDISTIKSVCSVSY
jgi:transposase